LRVVQASALAPGRFTSNAGCGGPKRVLTIATRSDPGANRRLRRYWTLLGAERVVSNEPGLFFYNVFSLSEADYR
jgi:hypothetical protein